MKKMTKTKVKNKAVKKSKLDTAGPDLVEVLGKLVERLDALELKTQAILVKLETQENRPAAVASRPPELNRAVRPQSNPLHTSENFNRSIPSARPNRPFEGQRQRTLYRAVCADCRQTCEVPVNPAEGRAVYCKPCFSRRKSGASHHTPDRRSAVAYMASKKAHEPFASQGVAANRTAVAPTNLKVESKASARLSKKRK